MSKRSRRKGQRNHKKSTGKKKPITVQPQTPIKQGKFLGIKTSTWKIIAWFFGGTISLSAAFLTIVIAIYEFGPSFSVATSDHLDPLDIFSTPFVVTNNSYLSSHDVHFSCDLKFAQWDGIEFQGGKIYPTFMGQLGTTFNENVDEIKPGESATVLCNAKMIEPKGSPNDAELIIVVSFRPSFTFWRTESKYNFVVRKNSKGQAIWFHQPISN